MYRPFSCFCLCLKVGDAYVCCSGLPDADEDHAINVANFAIAVQHCCRRVLSPLDKTPIELRVGIHTGACASGIVGVTNPRYCVFGDTVNTAARHESTSEPGRIHCSFTTKIELECRANADYEFISRGMIEMKGKGELQSYWLEASKQNSLVSKNALEKLDAEIRKEVKGMKEALEENVVHNAFSKAILNSIKHEGKPNVDERHTNEADIDESRSCGFSQSSSSSSSTPSRKELAQILARSTARSTGKVIRSNRRSRLLQAKNDIIRVLEVVEDVT